MNASMRTNLVSLQSPGARRAGGRGVRGPRPLGSRVYIETYGCQMNINDTELMEGLLAEDGFVRVDGPERADVILVNTCAIREHAERRVRGRIGELQRYRKRRPELVLGVTGCMAQRLGPRLIEEAAGVDLVAGPDAYRGLPDLIGSIQASAIERGQTLLELDADENYEGVDSVRRQGVSAWITVQRGCDHRCTFCIVPYVRGGEKNRAPEAILAETRRAVADGFSEVVLLGQTVNSYRAGDWDFATLLRAVSRVDGIRRVRFTSPHPNDVTPDLLGVMAEEAAVCRQLHLPVQSGSNRVLKRMVRRYTAEAFLARVEATRREVPGIALSTDVIVGFPGETEADFAATLDLMRSVRFDDAYLYRYSKREGTPATRFPAADFVSDEVSGERLEHLIGVHRAIQREINESEVGSEREVLVEREARSPGDVLGRTEQNKVVAFPGDPTVIGDYMGVRLTGTTGATFMGERLGDGREGGLRFGT
ncbi:tRNA (N6-isopentenyl adenosine(37)-C2)-methylthiotransferase MiaB [Candidatus Palauibacter sp.]|uniref:tRNA (N6-isopentenyl adenosine(37)-C2)-methylthiotransferase MiaB n=1 Tax=Candidatus Palauibacter sp. TaxID=3101350 RepID=UPI003B02E82A